MTNEGNPVRCGDITAALPATSAAFTPLVRTSNGPCAAIRTVVASIRCAHGIDRLSTRVERFSAAFMNIPQRLAE